MSFAMSKESSANTPERLAVNLKEAAALLGVSLRTVEREVSRGHLRAIKIGRIWRVRVVELREYLERGERRQRVV